MNAVIKDRGLYVKIAYPGRRKVYAARFPDWACSAGRLPVARRWHATARDAIAYRASVLGRLESLRKAAEEVG